ncbi:hypothetical protein TKK_0001882 [Trichogramma kaykai]
MACIDEKRALGARRPNNESKIGATPSSIHPLSTGGGRKMGGWSRGIGSARGAQANARHCAWTRPIEARSELPFFECDKDETS